MTDAMKDDLHERVQQFMMLQLPGQPMMMHMGTSYLVQDLWGEVKRLRHDALVNALRRIERFNGGQPRSPMQDIAKEALAAVGSLKESKHD